MTTDPVMILKERLAKAELKVARHKKALQAAESEMSDLQTALRVFADVMNSGNSARVQESGSTNERQRVIAGLLGNSREAAQAPADLFATYSLLSSEDINIETFRTTIWRMKDRVYDLDNGQWVIEGENGLYWKRPVGNIERLLGTPFHADTFGDEEFEEEEDDSNIPF
jgi:hypothetical protein